MTYVIHWVVLTLYIMILNGTYFFRMFGKHLSTILFFFRIKKGLDVEQATVEKDVEAEYKVRLDLYFVHL
jgi:hypothetical protein